MGLVDGMPIGLTTLVDHGPSDLRWDLVLVAEGYQNGAQQTVFNVDCDNFVKYLLSRAPFDCIDVESALNIHRVNVWSTDQGADDPATCGPNTGTGVLKNTYFDATYCGNGQIQRLLTVKTGLVTPVVDSYLSKWNQIAVLVNATQHGGSGGVIAVQAKAKAWADSLLHEIGHAAFKLADEYPCLQGCQFVEPAQNLYSGPEPAQPNVTAMLNPLKWANLLTPGPPPPTTTNLNCAQCDPALTSPQPAGTVGAFEGAFHFHCGVFRPEFNCLMRDHANGHPFCAACQQQIRQVLGVYTDFTTVPVDGAAQVEPWPATLKWKAGAFETSWQIQISTDPAFPPGATQTYTSSKDVTENGVRYGVTDPPIFLPPGKDLHWRVRKGGLVGTSAGWTKHRSFTTKAKVAVPLSPRTTKRTKAFRPWKLPFTWTGVDSAIEYEIQVTLAPDTIFSSPLFTLTAAGTKLPIDLRVDMKHLWRVRALPKWQDPSTYGPWSPPTPVTTTMPTVTIASPVEGEPVYPWPVLLAWSVVEKCDHYLVEIARDENGFGAQSAQKPLKVLPPAHSLPLNLRPKMLVDDDKHFWKVRVFGPELPTMPPLREEGKPDDSWFVNYGDDTAPVMIPKTGVGNLTWMGYNGIAELKFTSVVSATGYRVRARPILEQGGLQSQTIALDLTMLEELGDYTPAAQIEVTIWQDLTPPPGVGVAGYAFNSVAIGPENLLGVGAQNIGLANWIWPDQPVLFGPHGPDIEYDNAVFSFASPYTPSGKYYLALLEVGTLNVREAIELGNPGIPGSGETTDIPVAAFGISSLEPATTYEWWARSYSELPTGVDYLYPLSAAGIFVTKAAPPPPPPATPVTSGDGFNDLWGLGVVLCSFSRVEGADLYKIQVQQMELGNDNWDMPAGPLQEFPVTYAQCKAYTEYFFDWFLGHGGAVPDGLLLDPPPYLFVGPIEVPPLTWWRWNVAACAGQSCSPASPWNKWAEVFAWVWP